jgi:predicted RNA-binding Zn ribbon-like protein
MARAKASQRPYFPLLGEPLALDLVNTVVFRGGVNLDLIAEPHRWGQWLDYQRPRLEPVLGGPITEHCRSRQALEQVREFRGAVRVVIEAARAGPSPGSGTDTARDSLSLARAGLAHAAGSAASITTSATQLDVHLPGSEVDTEALLGAFAVATIELAISAGAGAIRECAAPDCGLLFMPRQPARLWCSTWTCGNRTRAARHYQQRRVPKGP